MAFFTFYKSQKAKVNTTNFYTEPAERAREQRVKKLAFHKTCFLTRQHGLPLLTSCNFIVYKNNHHKKLTMQKTLIVTLKFGLMSFLLK